MTNDDHRNTENADPHEQHNPIPKVVLGLVFGLVVWSVGYIFWQEPDGAPALGDHRVPTTLAGAAAGEQQAVDGSAIFANSCQACHQSAGQGLPGVFPPLAGSNWVLAPPDRIAQILLHGVNGPIEVLGTTYNGAMPAFGRQFSDAEIAAVASFVRKQWGNSAGKITVDQVVQARKATVDRTEPWPGGEGLKAFFSKNSIAGEGPK